MEIASITPAIRIIKEDGSVAYVPLGENIRVTDIEGRVFTGIFLYMELIKNEDDAIVLVIGNENIKIPCSDIIHIEKVYK